MTQIDDDRRVLVNELAEQLRDAILNGRLPSGARLGQQALATQFGVSRTPIREALRKLEESGLVELRPNMKAFVRGLSAQEVRDAYDVRAELEGMAAELAATRIRQEELVRLRGVQRQFEAALHRTVAHRESAGGVALTEAVITDWSHANNAFHQVILEAAGNKALVEMLAHLHRRVPRDLSRIVLSESTALLEQNVHDHNAILDAISRSDPSAARSVMLAHVRRSGALLTLRFEQRADGGAVPWTGTL